MSFPVLTLYHATVSPHARRVRMFISEKGLDVRAVEVNLGLGEQHEAGYRALNPRRVVPTLVLANGTAIGEVTAIWRYLEDRYPDFPLLGRTPEHAAVVTMWERRAELDGLLPAIEAVRNVVAGLSGRALAGPHDYPQIPALAIRSRKRLENFYADMDARLLSERYVAGDDYSAADITCLVTIDFAARSLGMTMHKDYSALRRWHATVSSRNGAVA
jgi:glutathione S-transferase